MKNKRIDSENRKELENYMYDKFDENRCNDFARFIKYIVVPSIVSFIIILLILFSS